MFENAHVTLCSSSRFYSEAKEIAGRLRSRGLKVYTPRFDYDEEKVSVSKHDKFSLTEEFLQKVEASNAIYIVNPGGYVGLSVAIETGFAFAHGKKIYAQDVPTEPAIEALLTKVVPPSRLPELC